MSWRDQQLLFNIGDFSIEVSIDLVDVLENDEIQDILANPDMDINEKEDWLIHNGKEIIQAMVGDKLFELKQWAQNNNMKIRTPPDNRIVVDDTKIEWGKMLLDLEEK